VKSLLLTSLAEIEVGAHHALEPISCEWAHPTIVALHSIVFLHLLELELDERVSVGV
jgi:hypothetical protein